MSDETIGFIVAGGALVLMYIMGLVHGYFLGSRK